VIAWEFDLQLPVQSVPITTKVASSNPTHGELYSIQRYVIKFSATCDRSVVFSGFLHQSGADPGFQVRGAHLKKLRRAEGGAKIFGVFRVKNHDFTPKNLIFSDCGGRRENF
jgi:hypothetical protein